MTTPLTTSPPPLFLHPLHSMAKQMAAILNEKRNLGPRWQECVSTTAHLALDLHEQCSQLLERIYRVADYSFQCNVVALNYLERMGSDTPPHEDWRAVVLTCLLLAQKMLDDCALWNVDFAHIAKMVGLQMSRRDINKVERNILCMLDYKVDVSRSLFVQTYFSARADSAAVSPVSPDHEEREELSMLKALDAQLSIHQPLHELKAKLNDSLRSSLSDSSTSVSLSPSSTVSTCSADTWGDDVAQSDSFDEFEKQLDFPMIDSPDLSGKSPFSHSRASTGWSTDGVMSRVMSAFSGNPEDDECTHPGLTMNFSGYSSAGSGFMSDIKAKDSVKLARKTRARANSSSGKRQSCNVQ